MVPEKLSRWRENRFLKVGQVWCESETCADVPVEDVDTSVNMLEMHEWRISAPQGHAECNSVIYSVST